MSISSFLLRPLWSPVGLRSKRSKGSKRTRVQRLKGSRVEKSNSGIPRVCRCSLALCVVFCLFGGVEAGAQTVAELIESRHVLIRARVEPAQVFVGQKVTLSVDVMTKTWFADAPAFPDVLDVENAIVIPPGPFGVNSSRVMDGDRYAVQTKKYSIIPTGIGRFTVPSFGVRLVVAREDASRSPEIVLKTPNLAFETRVPEAARGLGLVVSTPRLEIREHWSRGLDRLKVGDSVTRTLTTTIENSAAMLAPVPEFDAPEGVALYPQRPILKDERNRGEMRGSRVDRVVYTLEAEGAFDLAEIVIHWWEPGTGNLHREVLPGVHFEVEANPELVVETFGPEEGAENEATEPQGNGFQEMVDLLRPWVAVALFLAVAFLLFRRPLRAALKAWTGLRSKGAEEKKRFRDFKRTARQGRARSTVKALIPWLDSWRVDGKPGSLGFLVQTSGDPVLKAQIEALESAAFADVSGDAQWDPSLLIKRVSVVRSRGSGKKPTGPSVGGLPELNPKAGTDRMTSCPTESHERGSFRLKRGTFLR